MRKGHNSIQNTASHVLFRPTARTTLDRDEADTQEAFQAAIHQHFFFFSKLEFLQIGQKDESTAWKSTLQDYQKLLRCYGGSVLRSPSFGIGRVSCLLSIKRLFVLLRNYGEGRAMKVEILTLRTIAHVFWYLIWSWGLCMERSASLIQSSIGKSSTAGGLSTVGRSHTASSGRL